VYKVPYVKFEVFTAVTIKNCVFWDVTQYGYCKNQVSEELSPFIIRLTRIDELGTTLLTLMIEVLRSSETWFLQESHGVTFQKSAFLKASHGWVDVLTSYACLFGVMYLT
jgi:hypothetical protein